MIAVDVRDKDMVQTCEFQFTPAQLQLRSFAAIYHI